MSLTPETRKKVVIIPQLKNKKFILVRNMKTKNITFPGGGCKLRDNILNCAARELREETKNAIKLNRHNYNKLKYLNSFLNKTRSANEKENNNKRKLNVTLDYKIYGLNLENRLFKNIKNKFHTFVMPRFVNNKTRRSYQETNDIYNMSKNNIANKNSRLWGVMRHHLINNPTHNYFKPLPTTWKKTPVVNTWKRSNVKRW